MYVAAPAYPKGCFLLFSHTAGAAAACVVVLRIIGLTTREGGVRACGASGAGGGAILGSEAPSVEI